MKAKTKKRHNLSFDDAEASTFAAFIAKVARPTPGLTRIAFDPDEKTLIGILDGIFNPTEDEGQ